MIAGRKSNAHRAATEALAGSDGDRVVKAITELEDAVGRQPHDAKLANRLGDLQVRAGRVSDAISTYRKAADAYERDRHVDKAVAVWRKVIRLRPELLDVHVWLAEVYVRAGRVADARQVYESLIAGVEKSRVVATPNIVAIVKNKMRALDS